MGHRPGWLTAFCVIAICLGAFGLLMSLSTAVNLTFAEKMQSVFLPAQSEMSKNPMMDLQVQMQQEISAVTNRWKAVMIGLMLAHFVLAVGLVWGGIQAFRVVPSGRTLLVKVFVAVLIFECLRIVPTVAIQQEMMSVTERYMSRMMQVSAPSGAPMPPGMGQMTQAMMQASKAASIVFTAGWLLLKATFYVSGIVYLKTSAIRAIYAGEPPPDEADFEPDAG